MKTLKFCCDACVKNSGALADLGAADGHVEDAVAAAVLPGEVQRLEPQHAAALPGSRRDLQKRSRKRYDYSATTLSFHSPSGSQACEFVGD